MASNELLALWREVESRLDALLTELEGRLESDADALARDVLGHNELGLALETIADALSDGAVPITDLERAEMLVLVDRMSMDDRVSTALALCPRSA
jgi:hypothetical protein